MSDAKLPGTSERSDDPIRVPVPEPHATWLARLARRWTPPSLRTRRLTKLHWGDDDLSQADASLKIDGKQWSLRVEMAGRNFEHLMFPHSDGSDGHWGKPLVGRTEDGFRFSAKHGYPTSVKNFHTLEVQGMYCTLLSEARLARLWVGEFMCKVPATTSNLVVGVTRHKGDDRTLHWKTGLRLQGSRYTYFIVPQADDAPARLLVDVGSDSAPDVEVLDADLRSMEVTLGQRLHLDILYAYDEDEKLLGYSNADLRRARPTPSQDRSSPEAPVPTFLSRVPWVAPLFTSLSQAFDKHDVTHLKSAMLSYVDSLGDDTVDERYIRLQIAVGALANAVLQEQNPDACKLVRDESAWQDWLTSQRDVLAELAVPGAAGEILSRLSRAGRPDPGMLARRALTHLSLPHLPELEVELNLRDQVLACGNVTGDVAVDLETLVRRLQVLRVTLFAMLAKWIGYDGAIKGWNRDHGNHYQVADWWPVNPATREAARQRFSAEVADDTVDLWPEFRKPEVPKSGPLAAIARFASSLVDRTDGQVVATFQPVPQSSGDKMFEFKIMVAGNVGTQVTFFSANESGDGTVTILGWDGDTVLANDDAVVFAFLDKVAKSDEMRETVERLLILADELRRGERE